LNPNYLSVDFDRQVLLRGIEFARKIAMTDPLAALVSSPTAPAANVTSPADFAEFIRENVGTEWHPLGTAALAPRELGGVVDENLIVYGTKNLRVIDASVMPLQIPAHLQATVYAIAEKGANTIRNGV